MVESHLDVTAEEIMDRDYFVAVYNDWLCHRSKWRKHLPTLALLLIASGVIALLVHPYLRIFAVTLTLMGCFYSIDAITYRHRWLKARLRDLSPGKTMHVRFGDDELHIQTPNSSSNVKFKAFSKVVGTPSGVFLIPQTGVSIYLRRSAFQPKESFPEVIDLLERSIGT